MNRQPIQPPESAGASPLKRWIYPHSAVRLALVLLAAWVACVFIFYLEEDIRGKWAWNHYRAEARARGRDLDWANYIPPAVPDDQNVFKAPDMQNWFVGRGSTGLDRGFAFQNFLNFLNGKDSAVVARIVVVPMQANVPEGSADVVLRYDYPSVILSEAGEGAPATATLTKSVSNWLAPRVDQNAARKLESLIHSAVDAADETSESRLKSPLGFEFSVTGQRPMKQVRIVLRSDRIPDSGELQAFFPKYYFGSKARSIVAPGQNSLECTVHIEPDAGSSFFATVSPPPGVSAADYLEWSDQFQPEFEAIHEALQRPYARMDGDYEHPAEIPIPNFVCLRSTSQTLAQRAQCHLLLGAPDKALRELTVIHELCRMLEARPAHRPMTLIAAMINVAITGMYVGVIADGMRLHAWHEQQLATLQTQLGEIDLMPFVYDAFQMEASGHGRMIEKSSSRQMTEIFLYQFKSAPLLDKVRSPFWWLINFAPRGWIYQNMGVASSLEEKPLDALDLPQRLVHPQTAERGSRVVANAFRHFSPFNLLAAEMVPNFTRATQTFAKNQTLANEAFIACALERYRLAHGRYPETLDALVPEFAEKLPVDLIGGEPLIYRREGETFALYSIGWNERDDGGKPGLKSDGSIDVAKNDWVWPY